MSPSTHAHRPPVLVAFLLAVALLGAGCSGDDGGSDRGGGPPTSGPTATATSDVLAGIAEETIVPSYVDLHDDLDALAADVAALCEAPDPTRLAAAQDAWRAAASSWQATRAGAVGPAMDRRLMADVAFASRPRPVDALLASDEPIDTEALSEKGANFRGIHLVESLLFGERADALLSPSGARQCELMANVLPISTDAVDAVVDDWTAADPPHAETFASGADGDPTASVDELANQVIASLTALDDNGIRDLVVAESLDDVLESRRDGPAAHRMAEHRALLAGAARIIDGDPEVDGDGLVDLVEARSPDTAARLQELTDEAVAAVADLPDSADAAATDHAAELAAAAEAVAALKVLMTTEVASQLGITVRFSDADGDS